MATFTDDQFKMLLSAMTQVKQEPQPSTTRNDPSALGPMRTCDLGSNKITRLSRFEEWLEVAENRMAYIGTTDDASKVVLLKTWGGTELVDFMKTHAKINSKPKPATNTEPSIEADTYNECIKKVKDELRQLVNRTMAMYDLLTTKQGNQNWLDFIHSLERKAKILNFNTRPYTFEDAVKDAAIFGMNDIKLREKALAEDPNLETLTRWGYARESGRENSHNLKDSNTLKRIGWREDEQLQDSDIDEMMETLRVMKLKRVGKYSTRSKIPQAENCPRCTSKHPVGRCPANGKTCFT